MMSKFFVVLTLFFYGVSGFVWAQDNSIGRQNLANDVKIVITKILQDEKIYNDTNLLIIESNKKIKLNKQGLSVIDQKRGLLETELENLKNEQHRVEANIVKLTSKRYSKSMGIKYANKKSVNSVIDNQVYTVLFNSIKSEAVEYNMITQRLNDKISDNLSLLDKLNTITSRQQELISENKKLQKQQEENLRELRKKHRFYITKLEEMNKEQEKMKNILTDLDLVKQIKIVKSNTVKKITPSSKEFESAVNDISNESLSIPMYAYDGAKTIAPLTQYTVTQQFGKYYDAVYEAELFNKSITLESKSPRSRVINMTEGKILFIRRDSGEFKNIVIVHTTEGVNIIYSNLQSVSSMIRVGQEVPKRYILGTINTELILQATKENKYIDPEKLFQ